MTTHTTDTSYADTIRAEGELLAARTLEGRDPSMAGSWGEAGYDSAEEAAAVCIGDGYDAEVMAVAVPIVADAIRGCRHAWQIGPDGISDICTLCGATQPIPWAETFDTPFPHPLR